jgi:hypothetical protein
MIRWRLGADGMAQKISSPDYTEEDNTIEMLLCQLEGAPDHLHASI